MKLLSKMNSFFKKNNYSSRHQSIQNTDKQTDKIQGR